MALENLLGGLATDAKLEALRALLAGTLKTSGPIYGAAASAPVSGTTNASTSSAAFTPDLSRAIWVHLSGVWSGSVQIKRSTDGGDTWYAITTGDGTVKGVWTGNVNAAITEESCSGATYRLDITLTSGSVTYEVRQ